MSERSKITMHVATKQFSCDITFNERHLDGVMAACAKHFAAPDDAAETAARDLRFEKVMRAREYTSKPPPAGRRR